MEVLLVVLGAVLVALVVVLVAVHITRPARFSLGFRTKWGIFGLEIERPFYDGRSHVGDTPAGKTELTRS